jgi:hypothetical protein
VKGPLGALFYLTFGSALIESINHGIQKIGKHTKKSTIITIKPV